MKLLLLVGNSAVGKMTVGQEIMRRTPLRLFHNHMVIEPVLAVMGRFDAELIAEIRDAIFRRFAASDGYGMIFTYMWAFDRQEDWDYIGHVRQIFADCGAELYCAELVAPQSVRLARNRTENRLAHKASKRDLAASDARLVEDDRRYRCESLPGEVPFEHYLRIENADLSPEEAAERIIAAFGFERAAEKGENRGQP